MVDLFSALAVGGLLVKSRLLGPIVVFGSPQFLGR
jgi:hypothetical protein